MRLILAALALLSSTAAQADAVLAVRALPSSLHGRIRVAEVQVTIGGAARTTIAAIEARAASRDADTAAGQPMEAMLAAAVRDALGGLQGQLVMVTVAIDMLQVRGTGAAFLAKADRIAGLVEFTFPNGRSPIAEYYVAVENRYGGLGGLAIRGSGVREKLAREFAAELAKALRAPKPKRQR